MTIFSRKRDLLYLTFFIIHIPVMFCVDLAPIYPASIKPQFISDIRTFYIDTYHDRFFSNPPAWFNLYLGMELLYHTPLSVWAIGALLRDDPKIPIHLLMFAVQTALTTSTCIAEYLSWEDFSAAEKMELGKLYVPYLALSVFMGVDMYARLAGYVDRRQGVQLSQKKSL
ncbi:Hypothetical protein R9X50_00200200 [Acrodontium crateriforme]|uniref:Efficient mitochondria targeting-associated protein 19 n=1 Tax=Acrodontium crateriforme TaxID=150365 RepID=A0AAQ3M651_9PEZI|nr:Hypothetical protein R9X50_00200200 [Acrodontium crateriforme]